MAKRTRKTSKPATPVTPEIVDAQRSNVLAVIQAQPQPVDTTRVDNTITKQDLALILSGRRKRALQASLQVQEENLNKMRGQLKELHVRILENAKSECKAEHESRCKLLIALTNEWTGEKFTVDYSVVLEWDRLYGEELVPVRERLKDHRVELELLSAEDMVRRHNAERLVFRAVFEYEPSEAVLKMIDEYSLLQRSIKQHELTAVHTKSQLTSMAEYKEGIQEMLAEAQVSKSESGTEFLEQLEDKLDELFPIANATPLLPSPDDDTL